MESLSDKLRALGIKTAAQVPQPSPKFDDDDLSSLIPGSTLTNSLGSCYLSTTEMPLGYQHGRVVFDQQISTETLYNISPKIPNIMPESGGIFFLDTETTGLSGGTGNFAFLVGIGYPVNSGFRVDQYLIRNPLEEPSMLLAVSNFVESMSCIATFNGKAFDVPLMNNRYVLNRLEKPFVNLSHLDLLHISRRIWKSRLESRALQDLEREILEIPRDENEVPGWMIPEIYFEYQKTHDPSRLAGVMYHNRMDILSLAALTIYINQLLREIQESHFSINPLDLFSIGRIYDDSGFKDQAEKIYLECISSDALEYSKEKEAYFHLGMIYKNSQRWEDAISMFSFSSNLKDYLSTIELAKIYEHHVEDLNRALFWVRMGKDLIEKSDLPRYRKKQLLKEEEIRENRLVQKISKGKLDDEQSE